MSPQKKLRPYKDLLGIKDQVLIESVLIRRNDFASNFLKRILDLLLSVTASIILIPLFILIVLAVKLTSKGPAIYAQERVGRDGRIFVLYKFRSMVADAEKHTGPVLAKQQDERVTFLGKLLRRTRLDEFPQLWNVINGDMSIVGPRPEREYFVKQHKELQGLRLSVKPGLTGLAQIEGHYHSTPDEKWLFDEFYIIHTSFTLDILIIIKTIWIIFTKKGS